MGNNAHKSAKYDIIQKQLNRVSRVSRLGHVT